MAIRALKLESCVRTGKTTPAELRLGPPLLGPRPWPSALHQGRSREDPHAVGSMSARVRTGETPSFLPFFPPSLPFLTSTTHHDCSSIKIPAHSRCRLTTKTAQRPTRPLLREHSLNAGRLVSKTRFTCFTGLTLPGGCRGQPAGEACGLSRLYCRSIVLRARRMFRMVGL